MNQRKSDNIFKLIRDLFIAGFMMMIVLPALFIYYLLEKLYIINRRRMKKWKKGG